MAVSFEVRHTQKAIQSTVQQRERMEPQNMRNKILSYELSGSQEGGEDNDCDVWRCVVL